MMTTPPASHPPTPQTLDAEVSKSGGWCWPNAVYSGTKSSWTLANHRRGSNWSYQPYWCRYWGSDVRVWCGRRIEDVWGLIMRWSIFLKERGRIEWSAWGLDGCCLLDGEGGRKWAIIGATPALRLYLIIVEHCRVITSIYKQTRRHASKKEGRLQ